MQLSNLIDLLPEFGKAFGETFYMMAVSVGVAFVVGIPLGVLLFITSKGLFLQNRFFNVVLGSLANIIRSVPYIILLVALIPLTKILAGTTIGPGAASVSLSAAAIPFFARLVESSLREVDKGVIEAAIASGASPWLIIREVLLPEARPGIVLALTVTIISLLGYTAMAGIVGGGGIGDLAIRFGYYRFQTEVMVATVAILVVLVQVIQFAGDRVARAIDKR